MTLSEVPVQRRNTDRLDRIGPLLTEAAEIFAISNVDGALVGGASLTAENFSPIIEALENA